MTARTSYHCHQILASIALATAVIAFIFLVVDSGTSDDSGLLLSLRGVENTIQYDADGRQLQVASAFIDPKTIEVVNRSPDFIAQVQELATTAKELSSCNGYWPEGDGLWEFGPTPSYLVGANASKKNQLPYERMLGRSILVIGGSTSRDLAADFMQSVLPSGPQENTSNLWAAKKREGYNLFPNIGKHTIIFQDQYDSDVMLPLLDAGWRFEHLNYSLATSGCSGCRSSYTNIDYVATFHNITYEFSWKPEILSPSDEVAFRQRYCTRKYDVVYVGRGLHDAAFYDSNEMSMDAIRLRFLALAKILKCLPDETLIIFRSPYETTIRESEQQRVIDVTKVISDMIAEGHFDSNSGKIRSVLVDGMLFCL